MKMLYMISSMMAKVIDSSKAQEIARNFLAQSHAVLEVRNPTLEDHTWSVEADVTLYTAHHIKRVKINAETGRIMGCQSHLGSKTPSL